jgi:pimeloyl-ACP methyl ester carboxylesterase
VKITVDDGLVIRGSFYPAVSDAKAPTVLLLHQNESGRTEWNPIIPSLMAKGYNVLAIDQRGFGLTGGTVSYTKLEKDADDVLVWLRNQPTVDADRVAVIGASIGANVALRVCATDDRCHAVVALSPGLSFFSVTTLDAVKTMSKKGILLIAAQLDTDSAGAVRALSFSAPSDNSIMATLYSASRNHGNALIGFKNVNSTILEWLDLYNQKP